MSGEIRIIDPPVTGLPIGFGEHHKPAVDLASPARHLVRRLWCSKFRRLRSLEAEAPPTDRMPG